MEKPPTQIEFCYDDNCFFRAAKIMKLAGLKEDKNTMNRLAEGVNVYMELDGVVKHQPPPHDWPKR